MTPEEVKAMVERRRETLSRLVPLHNEARDRADKLHRERKDIATRGRDRAEELSYMGGTIPGFYPTPPDTARYLVELADVQPGHTVLEPSAGSGALAEEIRARGVEPDCIEVNYKLADMLRRKGFKTISGDFMQHHGTTYDRIIMNPPFERGIDAQHILHALTLLNPGGIIAAICSAGLQFREDRAAFRSAVDAYEHTWEELAAGTFKQSGTMVRSFILTIHI